MIVVTGDAGFVDSNTVKFLSDKGITDILMVDNLKDGTKSVSLVNLNIADYMDKEDFLVRITARRDSGDTEAIFREGVCPSTIEWDDKYMMDNNYQCSKELLHYCLECKTPFLHTFPVAAYGGRTSDLIESCEYGKSLNVYSYSKFLFDEHVRQVLSEANSQVVGFRYFNVYGLCEGHKDSMASVAFHLNTQLNNGETPKLFKGSENFKRDFVHVDDVAAVNLWFLKNEVSGIFSLGIGRTESFRAIADATLAYHKKGSTEHIPLPEKLKDRYQAFTQADLTNLHAADYGRPFKTVAKGITKYMIWLSRDTQV